MSVRNKGGREGREDQSRCGVVVGVRWKGVTKSSSGACWVGQRAVAVFTNEEERAGRE